MGCVTFVVGALCAATLGAAKSAQSAQHHHTAAFELIAALPLQNPGELDRQFWAVSTPNNERYLKFLSLEDLSTIVGAPERDIRAVADWFQELGASSVTVSAMRDQVTASFTAGPMTKLHVWETNGIPAKEHHPLPLDFLLRRDANHANHANGVQKEHVKANVPRAGGAYTVQNIKAAYGIPLDLQASNPDTLQMVWGPGTFGYSKSQLAEFKKTQAPLINEKKIFFDTDNHGVAGGDNYGEGNLDVTMISSFGLNVTTIVSNTNTSMSAEEGNGFGLAFLNFITELATRPKVPQVMSLSLGSLSAVSCELLCDDAKGDFTKDECNAYLQTQRQVCMYLSEKQISRINAALQVLGARGVTIFASSGDGGSHFSFSPFRGTSPIAAALNDVSCKYMVPVFPTTSPYVVSVGGEAWGGFFRNSDKPIAWSGSGGGFAWQFSTPAFQKASVQKYLDAHSNEPGFMGAGSFNSNGRAYPDISGVGVMGTSQSSPILAGIFSLIVDQRLNKGLPPLGFLGPRLWQVNEDFPGHAFEDITEGNSKTSCSTGFPAAAGWDPVTGWGRPRFQGLVEKFASD